MSEKNSSAVLHVPVLGQIRLIIFCTGNMAAPLIDVVFDPLLSLLLNIKYKPRAPYNE